MATSSALAVSSIHCPAALPGWQLWVYITLGHILLLEIFGLCLHPRVKGIAAGGQIGHVILIFAHQRHRLCGQHCSLSSVSPPSPCCAGSQSAGDIAGGASPGRPQFPCCCTHQAHGQTAAPLCAAPVGPPNLRQISWSSAPPPGVMDQFKLCIAGGVRPRQLDLVERDAERVHGQFLRLRPRSRVCRPATAPPVRRWPPACASIPPDMPQNQRADRPHQLRWHAPCSAVMKRTSPGA